MTDDTLDELIKAHAQTEGLYAVAYALLRLAEAVAAKQRRKQPDLKPEPKTAPLIG